MKWCSLRVLNRTINFDLKRGVLEQRVKKRDIGIGFVFHMEKETDKSFVKQKFKL